MRRRLRDLPSASARGGEVVGVNIGANKDAGDRVADYVAGVQAFADVASYFTINVSSPNTPGLRDLQEPQALSDLLARASSRRATRAVSRRPVLLKIAPDLTLDQLDGIVRVARDRRIDGMIVSNTTISRPATLRSPLAKESGGLSGAPLFDALDPDARADFPARRRPVPAHWRRRRRQRRNRAAPRSRRARRWCSSTRPSSMKGPASSGASSGAFWLRSSAKTSRLPR